MFLIRKYYVCVCVFDLPSTKNSPQYIATSDQDKELELQYRVHAALDVVEEKCAVGQAPTQDARDLYIGLLYSTEYHKMYVDLSFGVQSSEPFFTCILCIPFYISDMVM